MKHALLALLAAVTLTTACGGAAIPQDQLTSSQAAISAAEVGGEQGDPQAALLLKKAKDGVETAKKLIENGDNHRAQMVLLRAEADAQLALAIGQELATRNEAETAEKQVADLKEEAGSMSTFLRTKQVASWVLLVGAAQALTACGAAVAPEELHTARDEYKKAETSAAPQLAPVQLDEAKQALSRADQSFENGDKDEDIKDYSYVAAKKAEIAMTAAKREQERRDGEKAKADKDTLQQTLLDSTTDKLSQTRDALQDEKRRLADAATKGQAEVDRVTAELAAEKKAREDAEKRAATAMASLQEIAKVKEESRGVVITLSGGVLFPTGKSELLPIAQDKLNEVAKALMDQGFKKIVVEGHTDSRGSATQNEDLSRARAESVRTYLVSRGIPADKAEAVGYGSRKPVVDNDTAENRAENRRVEIVVTPPDK